MATPMRSIDASLPDNESYISKNIDEKALPMHCSKIPPDVTNLSECVIHQIRSLLEKSGLSEDEEDALDDGFVLCDINVVRKKLNAWLKLFPRIKPFFALKCHPDIMVAAVLGQYSDYAGFDCASLSEIRLALESTNQNERRIIYANPQRAEAELDSALTLGVEALTFDSSEELHKVKKAYEKHGSSQPPEMILRIVVPDGSSAVPLGEKFGAAPSKIEELVQEAMHLNIPVIGVSFHCGSGNHDPDAYGTAIRLAKDAIDTIDRIQHPRKCQLLDIGGGYPGADGAGGDQGRFCGKCQQESSNGIDKNCDEETAAKIAAVVTPLVDELFPQNESAVQIISEPGRYFVEAAFSLCNRIYSVKVEDSQRHYYIAQGVHGVFKDVLLCNESFVPTPLRMNDSINDSDPNSSEWKALTYPSVVHGPSGQTYDVVCQCELPYMEVGDWFIFDRMGAYTISIAARNGMLPIRYVVGVSESNDEQ